MHNFWSAAKQTSMQQMARACHEAISFKESWYEIRSENFTKNLIEKIYDILFQKLSLVFAKKVVNQRTWKTLNFDQIETSLESEDPYDFNSFFLCSSQGRCDTKKNARLTPSFGGKTKAMAQPFNTASPLQSRCPATMQLEGTYCVLGRNKQTNV